MAVPGAATARRRAVEEEDKEEDIGMDARRDVTMASVG